MRGTEKTLKGSAAIGKVKESIKSKLSGLKKAVSSGVSHKTTGLRSSKGRSGKGGVGSAG
jgi:hypothetical protein